MCICTPNIRTPFCGKPGCEKPKLENKPTGMTKEKFLHKFANLTFNDRQKAILDTEYGPVSWNVIWIEVMADSTISKALLARLHD